MSSQRQKSSSLHLARQRKIIMPLGSRRLRICRAFGALGIVALIAFVFCARFSSVHLAPLELRQAPETAPEPVANPTPDHTPAPVLVQIPVSPHEAKSPPSVDLPAPAITEVPAAASPDPPAREIVPHQMTEEEWHEDVKRLMSLHHSWMEYPEAISFPDGPSLLDATNPKPLKILFVNFHAGVENEVKAVVTKAIEPYNITVEFTQIRGVGEDVEYLVTDEAATAYYPHHPDHCDVNKYDLIIGGDVATYSRPYLHAHCKTNILLYITNRFDFDIRGEAKYAALVSGASRWPNVRLLVNNLYEPYYAFKLRHVKFHVYAYAPSTGSISPTAQSMIGESEVDWSKVGKEELVIVDRAQQHFLIDLCKEKNVPPPLLISNHYGGPLSLAGRFLVHIPYQVNTMAMFENMNMGVVYLLPSLRLYHEWNSIGQFNMDDQELQWTQEELSTYVDWWRPDLSRFFFYFDNLSELAPGSAFRERVVRESPEKQRMMKEYMAHHVDRSVEAWRQTLASFTRLSEAGKPMKRKVGLGVRLQTAHLLGSNFGINEVY
jgi:hypothetical protein